MRKMLVVHNIKWNQFETTIRTSNNVASWNIIVENWKERTRVRQWSELDINECDDYHYVMLILLPEQNLEKMAKYLNIIRRPGRKYKVIVDIPDVVGWQMNPFLPQNKGFYMDIVSEADFVMHYSLPETESYWKAIMRDKPSYNINRHFPIEVAAGIMNEDLPKATATAKEYGLKHDEPYIFVGKSLKNINEERNVICSFYVAHKIQQQTGWKVICFANNPLRHDVKNDYYKHICRLDNVIELPVLEWRNYIRILKEYNFRIGIYMDYLETRGQVSLDCASAGIPMVCSRSIAGRKLYPYTWLSEARDLDKATKLGLRIINDTEFREEVKAYATKSIQQYSVKETKKKFEAMIGEAL